VAFTIGRCGISGARPQMRQSPFSRFSCRMQPRGKCLDGSLKFSDMLNRRTFSELSPLLKRNNNGRRRLLSPHSSHERDIPRAETSRNS